MDEPIRRYPLAQVNYGAEEIEAVTQTLVEGYTTAGKRVRQFEEMFAEYVGARYATMVNSGSSADLVMMLAASKPEPGDEFLVPAVTWPTQVWSCLMAGYRVTLVDVDPDTLQMNTLDARTKINRHTKGVFLTHLLGAVGDIEPFLKLQWNNGLGLTIFEDCCEALGAHWKTHSVGTHGMAGAFSFFFSHILTTMEGGMVVTDDPEIHHRHKLLRNHGWEPQKDYRYWFPSWGLNVRPTEVQGAFGVVQLPKLEGFRAARTRNFARLSEVTYDKYPDFIYGPKLDAHCDPSWHGFPIMVNVNSPFTRDQMCTFLEQNGIETRPIVAGNLGRQPAICQHDDKISIGPLPGADLIHDHGTYIGVASYDDEDGIDYVGSVFERFVHALD